MAKYLYNGVSLPDIYTIYTPELQEIYPYAVITQQTAGVHYWLHVFSEPVVDQIGYGRYREASCNYRSTEWGNFTDEFVCSENGKFILSIAWSNHNILNDDGSIYLAASEPIPVYDFSYQEWIIATDETGDAVLQNGYTKAPYSEWYISSEATESTQLPADNVIWTNTTLNNTDGTVYLEASKGIWLIDLKDFLTGYLGLTGSMAMFNKGKTPTAYLYNGVKLPALPEWDREKYPYAYMTYLAARKLYTVYVIPSIVYDTENEAILDVGSIKAHCYNGSNPSWGEFSADEATEGITLLSNIVWANFDVVYNGTTYLEASEPVPVYE